MATATPYRWAKSPPPGSTLCPYCEVVYSHGGERRCAICGTKLVVLQQPAVAVAATAPSPPRDAPPLGSDASLPAGGRLPQEVARGFARAAGRRWIVPMWVTLLTVLATLGLDRLILRPHRLTSSTDIAPLLALGTGGAALFLALTALVSLGAGLVLGVALRRGRFLYAALGGAVIAFAHLSFTDLTLATCAVVLIHPLLWLVGASVSARWSRRWGVGSR